MMPLTLQAAAAVASLPITYTDELLTRVHSISGTAGWPGRAADVLRDDARAVVIVERPTPGRTDELNGLEPRVVLDSAWGNSPAIPAAHAALDTAEDGFLLAHVDVPADDDLLAWMLEGALLLDELVGTREVRVMDHSSHRIAAIGTTARGMRFALTVAHNDITHGAIEVRSTTASGTVELAIGNPAVALPATLRIDTAGTTTEPALAWESSSRLAWRRASAVADGAQPSTDLTALRAQFDLLQQS